MGNDTTLLTTFLFKGFCVSFLLGFRLADAGKSTIGGQILYLTGSVDERTIQKYEREAKDKNRDSW
jgi:hypothetical protein